MGRLERPQTAIILTALVPIDERNSPTCVNLHPMPILIDLANPSVGHHSLNPSRSETQEIKIDGWLFMELLDPSAGRSYERLRCLVSITRDRR
jgi:hypothetical protein